MSRLRLTHTTQNPINHPTGTVAQVADTKRGGLSGTCERVLAVGMFGVVVWFDFALGSFVNRRLYIAAVVLVNHCYGDQCSRGKRIEHTIVLNVLSTERERYARAML